MASRRSRVWLPWVLCGVSLALLTVGAWIRASGRGADPARPWGWLEETVLALAFAGIPVVGALIAARLPANVYGWLWCAIGLVMGFGGVLRPLTEALGGPPWIGAHLEFLASAVLAVLLALAILLFPTGRVPGPRWRWLARALVVAPLPLVAVGPFVGDPEAPGPWAVQGAAARYLVLALETWFLVVFAAGMAAVGALFLRYRRAGPVQRRQLTWFVYAALLATAVLAVSALGWLPWQPLAVVVQAGSLALFPAAVAVAVLRYRLYEIDRIVSRTVTYGTLTAAIFAVYLLVVAVVPQLGLPAGSSDVVVAAATLAVAAVVARVRRRLQAAVDRRFDRARYDAQRAVDAFAARLREQVDLDEVVGGLRDTVGATVAPTRVTVWLRPGARP